MDSFTFRFKGRIFKIYKKEKSVNNINYIKIICSKRDEFYFFQFYENNFNLEDIENLKIGDRILLKGTIKIVYDQKQNILNNFYSARKIKIINKTKNKENEIVSWLEKN